jgi:hypothetical protein
VHKVTVLVGSVFCASTLAHKSQDLPTQGIPTSKMPPSAEHTRTRYGMEARLTLIATAMPLGQKTSSTLDSPRQIQAGEARVEPALGHKALSSLRPRGGAPLHLSLPGALLALVQRRRRPLDGETRVLLVPDGAMPVLQLQAGERPRALSVQDGAGAQVLPEGAGEILNPPRGVHLVSLTAINPLLSPRRLHPAATERGRLFAPPHPLPRPPTETETGIEIVNAVGGGRQIAIGTVDASGARTALRPRAVTIRAIVLLTSIPHLHAVTGIASATGLPTRDEIALVLGMPWTLTLHRTSKHYFQRKKSS